MSTERTGTNGTEGAAAVAAPAGTALSPTPRTALGRHKERGRADRADLYAVLDAGLICHLGVLIDGAPIGWTGAGASRRRMSERELNAARQRIGIVFQQFNLWPHMSVLENVTEAPLRVKGMARQEAVSLADQLLAKVGLADKRDAYPMRLSGGQQQRVAIARALAMSPKVLLFDEPTSALDPELRREVLTVMRQLAAEGMTMIVVTHEMTFARGVGSRLAFMERGEIVEQAAPAEFFAAPRTERARRFLQQFAD